VKVRLSCDLSEGHDAHKALAAWLDEAEAGGLDGDELLAELGSIVGQLTDLRAQVMRALGA